MTLGWAFGEVFVRICFFTQISKDLWCTPSYEVLPQSGLWGLIRASPASFRSRGIYNMKGHYSLSSALCMAQIPSLVKQHTPSILDSEYVGDSCIYTLLLPTPQTLEFARKPISIQGG